MKKTRKILFVTAMFLALMSLLSLVLSAADNIVTVDGKDYDLESFDSTEDAYGANEYLSSYQDVVGKDAGFSDNLAKALATVREEVSSYGTFWSLLPPIIAIVLALITKEVYSSLFIGILSGGLIYAGFNLEKTFTTIVNDGIISSLADSWNMGILVFLVVLGIIVVLVNSAGGSAAYGQWATNKITSKRGALFATFGLGCLIFVDDYFNCLTVGSVMRPVADKFRVSRAKLAYMIDATAAPICMIAPISSWASAVTGVVEGEDGFLLFIKAIPYNFYSLLTIVMIIMITAMKFDYGPMKKHELNAEINGDLYSSENRPYENVKEEQISSKGKVIDLVLPVLLLIFCCIAGMSYTGYAYGEAANFIESFKNCDASVGLSLGSIIALIIIVIYYLLRRVLSFKKCMAAIPEGFKAMVPAILILTFAWTLSSMTSLLGAKVFVAELVRGSTTIEMLLPAIIFAIAIGLSFATGTSWGTFGILLPIVVAILSATSNLLIIAVSACLAGAVCGDHCSPISDTTIMSSAGAQSDHINHVSTQLPYTLTAAAVSLVSYVIAGIVQNVYISLSIAIVLMITTLLVIKFFADKKKVSENN